MTRIVIVIPTYNERGNVSFLTEKIFALGISGVSLFVIDDNSPDGTGELADELSKKYPIEVLHRSKKEGIGTAYVEAFKKILQLQNKPDYIIQMDADLSHDPAIIPLMIEVIQKCDLVLGSRYIPGGSIENWGWARRYISRFGNIYAQFVLGLPYKDVTGGFKCFRRHVLEKIDLDGLNSIGYCFQIETTYRAHCSGFIIKEIPISFTERKLGVSKFNLGIILESFWRVFLMRW